MKRRKKKLSKASSTHVEYTRDSIGRLIPIIGEKHCEGCSKLFKYSKNSERFCGTCRAHDRGTTNRMDNKKLRNLITIEPDEWIENQHGLPALGIYRKHQSKKLREFPVAASRLSTFPAFASHSRLTQSHFAQLFKYWYLKRFTKNGDLLLDLGCGESDVREFLYRNSRQLSYVGVELSFSAILKALEKRSKYPYYYLQYDLNYDLPFKSNSFDVVNLVEVIEHINLSRGKRLLKEIRRVLKPDGWFYVTTPDKEYAHGMFEKEIHPNEYCAGDFVFLLHEVGFRIVENHGVAIRGKHLKKMISEEHREILTKLQEFFPGEILRPIFAMLYTKYTYNKGWLCKKSKRRLKT